jgi:hypothetical protein
MSSSYAGAIWRHRGLILHSKIWAAGRPEVRTEIYFYRKNPDMTIDVIVLSVL